LYVLDGNLTGQKYRDNVLAPRVVPHFDNHALADRPMFMDDNARPHRAQIVQHFLQQEAVQTIPWPTMSPDMNPIEHVWDFIGRKISITVECVVKLNLVQIKLEYIIFDLNISKLPYTALNYLKWIYGYVGANYILR
jgi:transposase